jgi:hypothetical protein
MLTHHWLKIEFFLWLALGVAALLWSLGLVSGACVYEPLPLKAAQVPQQDRSKYHPKTSAEDQRSPEELHQIADKFFALVEPQQSTAEDAKPEERHSKWQQESWWGKFWCDLKASDAAIAFFTFAIFLATWFTIRSNDRMARDLERAYVSGGGPWMNAPPLIPQIYGFQLTVDNYGKSSATIVEFALEICDLNNLPERPKYLRKDYKGWQPFRAIVKPQKEALHIGTMQFPPMNNPVAYGRIRYLDIWRRPHFYSFILPSDPKDHINVSGLDKAYTDWN